MTGVPEFLALAAVVWLPLSVPFGCLVGRWLHHTQRK